MNKYLNGLIEVPTEVRSLADIISFNNEHASEELISPYYDDQSQLVVTQYRMLPSAFDVDAFNRLIASEASTKDKSYYDALTKARILSRTKGIDANFKKFDLDAILIPTEGQVRILRQVFACSKYHLGFASTPAALAGYPIVTGIHHDFLIHDTHPKYFQFRLVSALIAHYRSVHLRIPPYLRQPEFLLDFHSQVWHGVSTSYLVLRMHTNRQQIIGCGRGLMKRLYPRPSSWTLFHSSNGTLPAWVTLSRM